MEVDLRVLYRLLRNAADANRLLTYTELSQQYSAQTGDWVDPHLGWRTPLESVSLRCAGLIRRGHRPVLSAIVINNPDYPSKNRGRPGDGFWGMRTESGIAVTPNTASDEVWLAMCNSVFAQEWPEEFDQLPVA